MRGRRRGVKDREEEAGGRKDRKGRRRKKDEKEIEKTKIK